MKVRTLFIAVIITLAPTVLTSSAGAAKKAPWYAPIAQDHRPGDWAMWTCIIHAESRSTWLHPNLGDNRTVGSSGIFQIEDPTWLARSGFHFHVWQASPREQAIGALTIERVDGFSPWRYDGCV